jgi:hypothetical protein
LNVYVTTFCSCECIAEFGVRARARNGGALVLDWRVVRERKRQGHGIFDRLSGSLPGMREHRVSRVAEQRHGTASPASQRVSLE